MKLMQPFPNISSITVQNLSTGYDGKIINSKINFTLSTGETLCVVGESGIGKSTLLKTLAGKISPLAGQVEIEDMAIHQQLSLTREHAAISYLNQSFTLLNNTPILENFKRVLKHETIENQQYVIHRVATVFGIETLLSSNPESLSIGQQQRIALALALTKPAKIVILDEPFSYQDAIHKPLLLSACNTLIQQDGKTLILVSHEADDCMQLTDTVLLLNDYKIWFGSWKKAMRFNNALLASFFYPIATQLIKGQIKKFKVLESEGKGVQKTKFKMVSKKQIDKSLVFTHFINDDGISLFLKESIGRKIGTHKWFFIKLLKS